MGSDNLFKKRREERKKRVENIKKQKSSNWLIVCEGTETEPNYFKGAIEEINKNLSADYKLKVTIVGKGRNTVSLVKTAEDLQNEIDGYKATIVPYGKIFVVFDKDSFDSDNFNKAIKMCENNGYIPLWSNQAIEYWFLLHFNYIDGKMDRKLYVEKLNNFFNNAGLKYKYRKNDKEIFLKLCEYGSLTKARDNASKIHLVHYGRLPSDAESCSVVYKFFDLVDERLNELK